MVVAPVSATPKVVSTQPMRARTCVSHEGSAEGFSCRYRANIKALSWLGLPVAVP